MADDDLITITVHKADIQYARQAIVDKHRGLCPETGCVNCIYREMRLAEAVRNAKPAGSDRNG